MARIIVVNENDEEIGVKERNSLAASDVYRVSALWITSSQGDVLLAQRVFEKRVYPGKWGPAASGKVEEGEDYDINIVKETQEELGLTIAMSDLVRGPKVHIAGLDVNYFSQWYVYESDVLPQDLMLKEDEVLRVAWFTRSQLKEELATEPNRFTPSVHEWAKRYLKE